MSRKDIEEERLKIDLSYVLRGIQCHALLERICPPRYGLQVLEPACGSGKLGTWYALRGAIVTLLDIDPKEIRYAGALWTSARNATPITCSSSTPDFQVGSIHHLPFTDNRFDLVFNEGVAQHWTDWRRQRSLNEMVRVTKVGGTVCHFANNALCPSVMEMANSIDHDYKGMPKREKPFTPEELAMRLKRAGIKKPFISTVGATKWEDSALILGFGVKE